MRRKVPSLCKPKQSLNWNNIKNDKPSDIKKFYGFTEHQLEQNVRQLTNDMGGQREQLGVYKTMYGKKE
jgi:hypothetical protein